MNEQRRRTGLVAVAAIAATGVALSITARLRGDIDLSTVSAEIVETASTAVRPTTAGVWLRELSR